MPTRDEDKANGSFKPGESAPRYRLVEDDGDWWWIEEHVLFTATYWVACPRDRQCQVGMGLFVRGNPLGEKIRFSGTQKITIVGAGSIHVRVVDRSGPCWVAISQSEQSLLPIFSKPSLEVSELVETLRAKFRV